MSNGKYEKNSQSVTLSRKTLIILLIIILLLIAGGITLGFNWNNWFGNQPTDAPTASQGEPDIDPNAGDWKGDELPDKTGGEAVGIKIPGYPSITLPANQKDVTVAFLNPEGNPCYFTFELVLKDTGETLYKSKLVPPGQAITSIILSRALDVGEYDATIKISTTSLADQSPMNGANVETVLIVK